MVNKCYDLISNSRNDFLRSVEIFTQCKFWPLSNKHNVLFQESVKRNNEIHFVIIVIPNRGFVDFQVKISQL